MPLNAVFLIALALAVDAFAVAVAAGVSLPRVTWRHTFRLAWHFGLFQAGMCLLGWLGGLSFRYLIEQFDHWLAFGLLSLVGLRMIIEALRSPHENSERKDPSRGASLVMLSVATSIDALAVGLSFSILKVAAWTPSLIIGLVAASMTILGLYLGKMAGTASRMGERAEIAGGIVLIAIGVKILADHLSLF